ncbi:hypothetical protein BDN72DRAFT_906366 [Pluteus cervinus]|uniref:Uncharacterized protein n=1 Tax=Pluteus cervinus TaxID=181527 RepID=A0ACD2ZZG1_9AGAR|nr:hypothetical protein BDN72DRAFT_906366 [Pluteus cervinus]
MIADVWCENQLVLKEAHRLRIHQQAQTFSGHPPISNDGRQRSYLAHIVGLYSVLDFPRDEDCKARLLHHLICPNWDQICVQARIGYSFDMFCDEPAEDGDQRCVSLVHLLEIRHLNGMIEGSGCCGLVQVLNIQVGAYGGYMRNKMRVRDKRSTTTLQHTKPNHFCQTSRPICWLQGTVLVSTMGKIAKTTFTTIAPAARGHDQLVSSILSGP